MRFRDPRDRAIELAGLLIPLAALDIARTDACLRPSAACVSRRRVDGRWVEQRRINPWVPGQDLGVLPPVQDALPPLPPAV